jgi:hypothetical protein
LDDPLLPYPLTDIKAEIHCYNDGVRLTHLTCLQGQATWEMAYFHRHGYEANSPLELRLTGKQVHLDAAWSNMLPERWRTDWKNFDPEGDIDLDGTIAFDGQTWKPKLEARGLNNVSFSCHKFPYRLEHARGAMTLRDNVLDVAIVAHSGIQPVTINGRIWNPGPGFTGATRSCSRPCSSRNRATRCGRSILGALLTSSLDCVATTRAFARCARRSTSRSTAAR